MENPALYWGLIGSLIAVVSFALLFLGYCYLRFFMIKKQVNNGTYKSKQQKKDEKRNLDNSQLLEESNGETTLKNEDNKEEIKESENYEIEIKEDFNSK